jgi:hypothetical protein
VVPEYDGAETGNFDNPAAFSAPETFFAQESSVSVAAEAQEMLVVLARGTRRAAHPFTKTDVPCAATPFSWTNNLFLPSLCELIDDLFLQL